MGSTNSYPGLEPRVVTLVHHHASRLAASDCRLEQEDMEQELHLHLHLGTSGYCPGRGSRATYDDRLVRHRAADLARDARALKRGSATATVSLDQLLLSQAGSETGGGGLALPPPESGVPWEDLAALRCDIVGFLALQPSHLRTFCLLLLDHPVAAAARRVGRHRTTVYAWLARLCEEARAAGLDVYVKGVPSGSRLAE